MPYINEYTIVEDGDVYRIRLTDGNKQYDSVIFMKNLQEALDQLEALKERDGV